MTALFAGLWLMSAAILVGYFGLALAQWVRDEWRVVLFRRRHRRLSRPTVQQSNVRIVP